MMTPSTGYFIDFHYGRFIDFITHTHLLKIFFSADERNRRGLKRKIVSEKLGSL